ncbi:hypothetical protein P170DRAFT_436405 [Aspergillus steynii IBT 23096]|uniref:Secreted protein n=1 Tax=Aspergillus steynii IBT 23096 TaxID=1392250 RepID=A0A2I2GEW1_9EURO|nr:uncharacterized protein P170DRAFT_436405 [Aspergillus steynii IBT 23096]PLB51391.1 hypothetical protein P170DRAFT_436405 [Aspergillus steynii IBT 23096]
MLFRASALCMALISLPLAAALPTTTTDHSRMSLSSRDDTQCEAGKAFYVCNLNNFRGCCSVDPCALQDGCPDKPDNDDGDTKPTPGSCPKKGEKTRLFQPQMQTLILPDTDKPIPAQNFDLIKSNTTERQQIASWALPAEAKDCSVGWSIPEKRNFSAGHTARVSVHDNDDNERLGGADFSFWPETPGPRSNLVAAVDCKESVSLRLAMELNDQVFLEQNEETGWWVEYSC